jgi:HAE1 family hydrophobic/amphiphilic exporter-1
MGLFFIPVTFAVVEYLSHRFVRGGRGTTMDSKPAPMCGPNPEYKPAVVNTQTEGGQA